MKTIEQITKEVGETIIHNWLQDAQVYTLHLLSPYARENYIRGYINGRYQQGKADHRLFKQLMEEVENG